jgi:carbon-monoxide dehydrogenase medium subunit
VATGLALDRQGRTRWARIALGAVAPTPLRVTAAEQFLEGKPPTATLLDQAARMAGGQVRPVSDVRASAVYRRQMSQVMVRRALTDCAAQLGQRSGGAQ